MNGAGGQFRDEDLHAFADGVSAPERRAALIAYLATSPADTDRVLGWQRQNELLRNAFPLEALRAAPRLIQAASAPFAPQPRDGAAGGLDAATMLQSDPPLAAPMLVSVAERRRGHDAMVGAGAMVVAALAALLAGLYVAGSLQGLTGLGWLPRAAAIAPALQPASAPGAPAETVVGRALEAHLAFAEDLEVPVEFDAKAATQLVAYLSHRVGVPVQAPNLTAQGFQLLGGRLLPVPDGVAAMLVYEAHDGQRVGLVVTRATPGGDAGLQYQAAEQGPVHAVRWSTGDEIYVLTSRRGAAETLRLAVAAATGVAAARPVTPSRPGALP